MALNRPQRTEKPNRRDDRVAKGARLLSECGGKLPPRVRIPLSPPASLAASPGTHLVPKAIKPVAQASRLCRRALSPPATKIIFDVNSCFQLPRQPVALKSSPASTGLQVIPISLSNPTNPTWNLLTILFFNRKLKTENGIR